MCYRWSLLLLVVSRHCGHRVLWSLRIVAFIVVTRVLNIINVSVVPSVKGHSCQCDSGMAAKHLLKPFQSQEAAKISADYICGIFQRGDHNYELQDNLPPPPRFLSLHLLPPCTQALPRGD